MFRFKILQQRVAGPGPLRGSKRNAESDDGCQCSQPDKEADLLTIHHTLNDSQPAQ